MNHVHQIERARELAILEVLHAEYPDADTITLAHVEGNLYSYEVVEDGIEPVRSFLNWK
jgi:hypothetical protein